jgi:hypothetical protein
MAQVVVEMSSDEAKLLRGMQRILEAQRKMDKGQKDIKEGSDKAGKSQEKAFGSGAANQLIGYAAGFIGVSAAIGKVVGLLREVIKLNDEAAAQQRQAAPGLGELAQLAESPEDFRRLVSEAKKTFAEGGAKDLEQAAGLQFALVSAGLGRERQAVAQLQGTGVVRDATGMITAAAAITSALGEEETGDFQAVVSKMFGASRGAPAFAQDILQATAQAGAQAGALGITDEELMGAVATISKTTGTAERAGTQVESFLKQVEKTGIGEGFLEAGLSMREYVAAIDKLVESGVAERDILGSRQEALTGYRLLSKNVDAFNENIANIIDAERTDAFGRKVAYARDVQPDLQAAQALQRAEAQEQLAREREGTTAQFIQTLQKERVAQVQTERGTADAVIERMWDRIDRFMFRDEAYLEKLVEAGVGSQENRQAAREFLEAGQNLRQATNEFSNRQQQRQAAGQVPE